MNICLSSFGNFIFKHNLSSVVRLRYHVPPNCLHVSSDTVPTLKRQKNKK